MKKSNIYISVGGDDMDSSINLTDTQILRQISKLKGLIFENYIENTDGTYEGELNDSVARIIEGLTTQVTDLDEGEFINLIRKGIKELIRYFEGNVDSINEDIIHFFAFDFITQTLNFRYGAVYQNKIDEFDPMFN